MRFPVSWPGTWLLPPIDATHTYVIPITCDYAATAVWFLAKRIKECLYVPHEPAKMIEMMGGKEQFSRHLDSLFTMELPDKYFENTEDISREGIIGNYVHGNEPSHHVAYLYNWTT